MGFDDRLDQFILEEHGLAAPQAEYEAATNELLRALPVLHDTRSPHHPSRQGCSAHCPAPKSVMWSARFPIPNPYLYVKPPQKQTITRGQAHVTTCHRVVMVKNGGVTRRVYTKYAGNNHSWEPWSRTMVG